MKLPEVAAFLDRRLEVAAFDDVSNNGIQIESPREIRSVAVAVDASLKSVKAAAEKGADLLVVHHGISWGGGMKRLTGGLYAVVKAAMDANLAVYACHLPLDAHPTLGNNAGLARELGLTNLQPAFSYHGNVIGFVGLDPNGEKVGVCSGGAGEFAEEAKKLGCARFVTGEASWGDVIAAENCGMRMECRGHYETEVYGVRALGRLLSDELGLAIIDLTAE